MSGLSDFLKGLIFNDDGSVNPTKAATTAAGLAALYGSLRPDSSIGKFIGAGSNQQPIGYMGGIPEYKLERSTLPSAFAATTPTGQPRRPGSGGRRYFTDSTYTPTGKNMPEFAQGGLASLAQPQGYYLGGATDGMADEIPATIENTEPAALSDGEFVIPADVVSHLGNGNSDAGAKQLYAMMDRIRQARTGRKEQGRKINPNKYIPV